MFKSRAKICISLLARYPCRGTSWTPAQIRRRMALDTAKMKTKNSFTSAIISVNINNSNRERRIDLQLRMIASLLVQRRRSRKDSILVRAKSSWTRLQGLLHLLTCLSLVSEEKMVNLLSSFPSSLQFDRFDLEQTSEEKFHLKSFPDICQQHLEKKRLAQQARQRHFSPILVTESCCSSSDDGVSRRRRYSCLLSVISVEKDIDVSRRNSNPFLHSRKNSILNLLKRNDAKHPITIQWHILISIVSLGTRNAMYHCYLSSRSRYDTNRMEATGLRETSPILPIDDVQLLLLRFVDLQSFSEDTGGWGRESNLRLTSYQIRAFLYVLSLSLSLGVIEKRNSCRTFSLDQNWRSTNHSTSMELSFWPHSSWSSGNPSIGTKIESSLSFSFPRMIIVIDLFLGPPRKLRRSSQQWPQSSCKHASAFSSISNKIFSPVLPLTSSSIIAIESSLSLFYLAKNKLHALLHSWCSDREKHISIDSGCGWEVSFSHQTSHLRVPFAGRHSE